MRSGEATEVAAARRRRSSESNMASKLASSLTSVAILAATEVAVRAGGAAWPQRVGK